MNTLKILVVASTAFVAFATVPAVHAAAEAVTAEQHAAMAQEFQAKAATATEKARLHQVMARTGGSPKSDRRSMSTHCEHLIAQYRAEADAYSAQAAEHQRLATTK